MVGLWLKFNYVENVLNVVVMSVSYSEKVQCGSDNSNESEVFIK